MGLLTSVFGDRNTKELSRLRARADEINALEPEFETLSDEALRAKTSEFKTRLEKGETLDDILPEAFATVREVARRTLEQRHYDVQLMGGITIHEGKIAEMRTGEGKTLVATLPTYLNALAGKGVHVVTVNDYLARRDAAWMGQIYNFLGLSISVINSGSTSYIYDETYKADTEEEREQTDEERDEEGFFKVAEDFLRPCTRPEAYQADITYGTNSEFGFDYLRDNISYKASDLRQRGHAYAIIDEIDSILIDEARTPLIISAPSTESENLYQTFAGIVRGLKEETDYTVDEKQHAIQLTDQGIEKAEKELGMDNIYTEGGMKYVHHLETAVRAKALFLKDREYVVQNGNVVIVDQSTGRLMPTRRYSEGLHQALEAKEGLEVRRESRTFASVTYQNYFRMYDKLSGMTGTAKSSEEEFFKVYSLDVVVVPTNKPIARIDHDDFIFQTQKGKFGAIARKVKELNEKGQPVLVGTVSVENNELLSSFLTREGVKHNILNAKHHEQEGEIIAQAGRKGAVTIATNMAGRGVDIKLGGENATLEEYEEIKTLGGLFVLGTERHNARRIDNQLRGRAGRQGDPGETQFFVSLEDDLMRVFATDSVKKMMGTFGIPEDEPIQNKMITRALENAQNRIEGHHFDARKHVLQYDDVLNTQRKAIYARRHAILTGDLEHVENELKDIALDENFEKVLKEKEELLGKEQFLEVARRVILQTIDMLWVDHLETMDYLRSSVGLRGYGQRDPLVEYKKEGLHLYKTLESDLSIKVQETISNIGEGVFEAEKRRLERVSESARKARESSERSTEVVQAVTNKPTTEDGEKIGRNDIVLIRRGEETQTLKYKKAEPLLSEGWELIGLAEEK